AFILLVLLVLEREFYRRSPAGRAGPTSALGWRHRRVPPTPKLRQTELRSRSGLVIQHEFTSVYQGPERIAEGYLPIRRGAAMFAEGVALAPGRQPRQRRKKQLFKDLLISHRAVEQSRQPARWVVELPAQSRVGHEEQLLRHRGGGDALAIAGGLTRRPAE